ncbi:hypothetical protein IQ247_11105 [Plectonema cf. radiosum LEGE 06105]|uniref:Uncharacterized protein n=1 Tax=Plectonema cf. radiosum LEGE 06105 TaxID=945769 RepID=A0A8J7F4B7_9CYAN|nr:hypothetical protein [Plectonema radiosum]MBE9213215.1 hypothetical protein [Plectonema cf. radiosum LEGE 06105]
MPDISPKWNIDERLLSALKILFWIALSLFLAWIALQLWREFRPYFYTWWGKINRFGTGNGKPLETQF